MNKFKSKEKIKSPFISVIDETLRFTWILLLMIITNFTIIVKKINKFNLNIDINILLLVILSFFVIFVFIYNLVIWRISRYELKENKIVVYKNIFINEKKEFLIDNIANICISRSIFERLLGLYRIKIYTDKKRKLFCDINIIIKKYEFNKSFFNLLIKGVLEENSKYEYNTKFSDIVKHSVLSISISSMILIINLVLFLFSVFSSGNIVNEVLYDSIGFIVTIFGFIFPIIYSIIKNVIEYFKFKITKKDKYLIIYFGMFTKKTYIIPINKINEIIIDVSFLSKLFGCYKVNIVNSGIGDRKSELEMIIPISSKEKCKSILKNILPEYRIDENYKIQPLESMIVVFSKIVIVMLLLVIPFTYINIKLAFLISIVLFLVVIFIYFIKRIIIEDKYICIINGVFIKRMKIIKYDNINDVEIIDGIISSKIGLCKVYFNVMADFKNARNCTGYIKLEDMYKIMKNLKYNTQ